MKQWGYPEGHEAAKEYVLYEVDQERGVAYITLNRPSKLNAMSVPMRYRLTALVGQANADPVVKAIALRGAGKAYTAGDEVNEDWGQPHFKPGVRNTISDVVRYNGMVSGRTSFAWAFAQSAKPIVTKVHGYAFGAGYLYTAAQSDIVVVTPDAKIGNPMVRYLGAVPADVRELRIMGRRGGWRLSFTGKPITGQQAFEMGLADAVAPPETIDAVVEEILDDIVQQPLERILALKARLRGAETVIDVITPARGQPGHGQRPAKDEPNFWATAAREGLSAALAQDRARAGVIDPRRAEEVR